MRSTVVTVPQQRQHSKSYFSEQLIGSFLFARV
jgi:hypothetical protein